MKKCIAILIAALFIVSISANAQDGKIEKKVDKAGKKIENTGKKAKNKVKAKVEKTKAKHSKK